MFTCNMNEQQFHVVNINTINSNILTLASYE